MTDLKELAAKCRNPVVRNALLAAATGNERERAEADRLAFCAARDAGRDAIAARARLDAFARAARAAGLRGDPDTIDTALDMADAIAAADTRLSDAKRALRALRRIGTGSHAP